MAKQLDRRSVLKGMAAAAGGLLLPSTLARAAEAAGIPFIESTLSLCSIEDASDTGSLASGAYYLDSVNRSSTDAAATARRIQPSSTPSSVIRDSKFTGTKSSSTPFA